MALFSSCVDSSCLSFSVSMCFPRFSSPHRHFWKKYHNHSIWHTSKCKLQMMCMPSSSNSMLQKTHLALLRDNLPFSYSTVFTTILCCPFISSSDRHNCYGIYGIMLEQRLAAESKMQLWFLHSICFILLCFCFFSQLARCWQRVDVRYIIAMSHFTLYGATKWWGRRQCLADNKKVQRERII